MRTSLSLAFSADIPLGSFSSSSELMILLFTTVVDDEESTTSIHIVDEKIIKL